MCHFIWIWIKICLLVLKEEDVIFMLKFIIIVVILIIVYIILAGLMKAAGKDTPVNPEINHNENEDKWIKHLLFTQINL